MHTHSPAAPVEVGTVQAPIARTLTTRKQASDELLGSLEDPIGIWVSCSLSKCECEHHCYVKLQVSELKQGDTQWLVDGDCHISIGKYIKLEDEQSKKKWEKQWRKANDKLKDARNRLQLFLFRNYDCEWSEEDWNPIIWNFNVQYGQPYFLGDLEMMLAAGTDYKRHNGVQRKTSGDVRFHMSFYPP